MKALAYFAIWLAIVLPLCALLALANLSEPLGFLAGMMIGAVPGYVLAFRYFHETA